MVDLIRWFWYYVLDISNINNTYLDTTQLLTTITLLSIILLFYFMYKLIKNLF